MGGPAAVRDCGRITGITVFSVQRKFWAALSRWASESASSGRKRVAQNDDKKKICVIGVTGLTHAHECRVRILDTANLYITIYR